jgi:hypothetical protein
MMPHAVHRNPHCWFVAAGAANGPLPLPELEELKQKFDPGAVVGAVRLAALEAEDVEPVELVALSGVIGRTMEARPFFTGVQLGHTTAAGGKVLGEEAVGL